MEWETSGHELCHGILKGLRVVLQEKGVNTHGMNADQRTEILGSHPDFRNEKSLVEPFLMEEKGTLFTSSRSTIVNLILSKGFGYSLSGTPRHTVVTVFIPFRRTLFQHWNLCLWKVFRNTSKRCNITCCTPSRCIWRI